MRNFFNILKKKNNKYKKKLLLEIRHIILTISDGYDLPFFQYTQLGVGNLILTYLYALHLKLYNKNMVIIPYYPIRVIPIIRDIKYWYLRSSFEFNYNIKHLKRLSKFLLLGKTFKDSFVKKNELYLNTNILSDDTTAFEKISSLKKNYIRENIIPFLNFDYKVKKKNTLKLISNKNKKISLGLHLRRGDFIKNKNSSIKFNVSPSINSQIKIIRKIKSKIKVINIYSDQSHSQTIEELNGKLENFKLNLFPTNSNGSAVLKHMIMNDVIILSNSTLSIISCILSNQLGLFNNQILPNKLKKYFRNIKEIKC